MVIRDPSCDDDFDPDSLSCETALARILAQVSPVSGYERLNLRAALGRVLSEPLYSPFDVPAHTNSAMDGYALSVASLPASGTGRVRVVGSAFAGRPFNGAAGAGEAVRIMTGAAMPAGTDAVVMQEHVVLEGDGILLDGQHQRGQNVRVLTATGNAGLMDGFTFTVDDANAQRTTAFPDASGLPASCWLKRKGDTC